MKIKAIKKPIEIEAIQWNGRNLDEIKEFVGKNLIISKEYVSSILNPFSYEPRIYIEIKTLEGNMLVREGDYIIKGVQGEFYPCKQDIFEKTYDIISQND